VSQIESLLRRKEHMSGANYSIRHGFGMVRPYLYGNPDLFDFVRQVFRAEELEQNPTGSGFHVEVKIGDSVVVLEIGEFEATAPRAQVYVYVQDVDATYQRALQAGATSVDEPTDKPYQERGAGVKDTFGNTWWIATYTGSN
jgi:PhnB protein